ncbi:MAG: hypothetical protein ACFFC3_01520 [Candidatus Odinarchaeota archaeon]
MKKLGKNPKPIILTLISNWIITPFMGLMMARIFLPGHEQLVSIDVKFLKFFNLLIS